MWNSLPSGLKTVFEPGVLLSSVLLPVTSIISNTLSAEAPTPIDQALVELENVLPKITNLRAVKYNFIADEKNTTAIGFIAQDWQTNFSEVVSDSIPEELGMNYTETIPVLLKAIQELKAELDTAKARITTLEG